MDKLNAVKHPSLAGDRSIDSSYRKVGGDATKSQGVRSGQDGGSTRRRQQEAAARRRSSIIESEAGETQQLAEDVELKSGIGAPRVGAKTKLRSKKQSVSKKIQPDDQANISNRSQAFTN